MTLSIKDPEADRLARLVAAHTGETITTAVISALRERLAREERKSDDIKALVEEGMAIGRHFCSLPEYDTRSLEEILYDENGIPK